MEFLVLYNVKDQQRSACLCRFTLPDSMRAFFARSLKAPVLRPVACDPAPGARGKGQGPKPAGVRLRMKELESYKESFRTCGWPAMVLLQKSGRVA